MRDAPFGVSIVIFFQTQLGSYDGENTETPLQID
jgi:hypothetical protein